MTEPGTHSMPLSSCQITCMCSSLHPSRLRSLFNDSKAASPSGPNGSWNGREKSVIQDSVPYEFIGLSGIEFPRRLKPESIGERDVRAEARTLQTRHTP